MNLLARLTARALLVIARGLTGVRCVWRAAPTSGARVYFANHASHADFVLVWAALPPRLRATTRPVAAAEYWLCGAVRRFLAVAVFKSVLVDRVRTAASPDPIEAMALALDAGDSLIFFPEGTRNTTNAKLLPFKSGLFRLARSRPTLELVPVWIANLQRVLPKGSMVPMPSLCTVTFGCPVTLGELEQPAAFLERARRALLDLAADGADGADAADEKVLTHT